MFETISTLPLFQSLDIVAGRWVLTLSNGAQLDKGPATGADGSTGPSGRGITHTDIVSGDLVVTYSDGTTATPGHVLGADGTAGRDGIGIASIEIVNGRLHVTLSNGTVSDLGQVVGATGSTGAAGVGVSSSTISGGHLVITYTNGTTQDLGQVTGATGATGSAGTNGRGISSSTISGGHLFLTYTDGTTQDLGQVVGAAGSSGSASVATLRRAYISTVEVTSSNGNYNFSAVIPAGATEVEIEAIGGGASGYSGKKGGSAGAGGEPGSVARIRMRVADVPSTLALTVGAGGSAPAAYNDFCYSNPGYPTIVGSLIQAPGGLGGQYASAALFAADMHQPSDMPSSRPGRNPDITTTPGRGLINPLSATPGYGPGAGGAGLYNPSDNYQWPGDGGDSGVNLPASTVAGARAITVSNSPNIQSGANAADSWGFGSGGAGQNNAVSGGASGGAPGGGGGGGAAINGNAGPGGPGAIGRIRFRFFHFEAP